MKIFFVGDFRKDTGPGIANKVLRKGLSENSNNILYSDCKNKLSRVIEMLCKIIISDCVCFCSPSKANIIGIRIAKLFRKKSFYIMHGYLTYEKKINSKSIDEIAIKKINNFEKYLFKNVEKVFCVSKKFMEFMKQNEPEYIDKFDYNFNGLDLHEIEIKLIKYKIIKNKRQIVSIGGGMPQKNNLTICKAIEKINQEKSLNLNYIVIGLPYTDKEKICNYNFVTYYDSLPHEKVLDILAQSSLYIQNSSFETFGLSIIEALLLDCNLLISDRVGVTDILETIKKTDLIFDITDVNEISKKIENLLINNNSERLKKGLKRELIEYKKTAKLLLEKISNNMGGNNEQCEYKI